MHSRTITQVRAARRARSVSLVARGSSDTKHLQELPSELLISILELALLRTKPQILAIISRGIHQLLNHVLYRTIILESPRSIQHLHRTAITDPHLLSLVKQLVVTCVSPDASWKAQVVSIIAASKNLRNLTLPTLATIPDLTDHHHLAEVTTPSFIDGATIGQLKSRSNTTTHLRFTEPNEYGWLSPCDILDRFGNPPNLTHLQVSRRAGANEDNDIAFANELAVILSSYTKLRMLVVSIFSGYSWEASGDSAVEESHVWKTLLDLKALDRRVVLAEGVRDEWKKEYMDFRPADSLDSRFWAKYNIED